MTALRPLSSIVPDDDLILQLTELVYEAGTPLYDWLHGGRERALARIRGALVEPASELALENFTGLFDDGQLIGCFLGLAGADLSRRRRAGTLALIKQTPPDDRARLRDALKVSEQLLAPVADDEFYLHSIAVLPAHRSAGHGRTLLEGFFAAGQQLGLSRFRLEVWAGNAEAKRLYESAGFRVERVRTSEVAGMTYLWMTGEGPVAGQ